MQTKTPRKLIKIMYGFSICVPLVTLQTSTSCLNSSHVRHNCNLSTLAIACEIRSRSRRRDCGIRRWQHACSFTYFHRQKSHGMRSGDLGGHGMDPAPPIQAFCSWDAIFLRYRTERHSRLMLLVQSMLPTITFCNLKYISAILSHWFKGETSRISIMQFIIIKLE
jgi:hypothetical protein